jgi:hypothetical protein
MYLNIVRSHQPPGEGEQDRIVGSPHLRKGCLKIIGSDGVDSRRQEVRCYLVVRQGCKQTSPRGPEVCFFVKHD